MLLASMAGLSNGANVQLWNAGPTPISAMAWYAGDAQHGKSRIAAAIAAVIAAADDEIAAVVQERLDAMPPPNGVNQADWEQQRPKKLTVRTIGMQDFTATEFFARCSGTWAQIKEAPDLVEDVPDLAPRAWYGALVNLDEAYSFLGKLGLIGGDVRGGGSKETSPSEHASTLNTLMGTGKLQRDTRTSGITRAGGISGTSGIITTCPLNGLW